MYNGNKVKALSIMLPKTVHFFFLIYGEQTKWIYFLIEDDELLEKFNTLWDNVSTDIRKMITSLSTIKNI